MRRLLKLRTWGLRSTSAAETSLVLVAATLIVPVLLFAGASWMAYDDTRRQAEERIARTLDLLYVNVRTTFDTDLLVIANIAEIVDDYSNEGIRANEQRIHDRLKRLVESLPQIQNAFVIDADGRALVSAKTYPLPPALSTVDRSYFAAHRDGAQRNVSEILRGRLGDAAFFQYSERRETPDGKFNGVIAVSISPQYFIERFSQATDAKGFTAALVRADGEILARYPGGAGPSRLGPNSGFVRSIALSPEVGMYDTDRSGFDGRARIFMYRRLSDLPIYVVHGYAKETIRDAWLDRMASHLIFELPATLALFALALLASRRAMQESAALARLKDEKLRRESAEDSLRQTQKMMAVGQLTAGIAHDFNNLLTGIGGALEMIGRRLPDASPELARFVDLGRAGVSRAAELTQRLLAFSRQQPLKIEAVDANRLVAGMSELLRRTLGEKVKIETVLAGGLWHARADAAQLESAILNLAINGRDAMADGGTLTIETANAHLDDAYAASNDAVAGQYVMIAVSDTGSGMTQETIARAFEPFFTTKPRGQGTGLGLSMTFGYVKQVGGHLNIYSEIGRGTVVKVYMPRAVDEAKQGAEPAQQPLHATDGSLVVLVVEDDPVVREFAISACREIGCTVYHAGDGTQALAVLEAHDDIGLLFTDVGLPGTMNGRQLAAVATERWPGLKVLFTTGYTANAIVHHGVLDPGVNFIGKPFTITALGAKIKSLGF